MAKRADVNLVISAQNLAKKDLKEIGALLDGITEAQNKQASSADLAATSIGKLKAEQQQLTAALKELERREKLVAKFREQQAALKGLIGTLAEARERLKQLQQVQLKGGFGVDSKKVAADLRKATSEVARLQSQTRSAAGSLKNTAASLEAVGVSTREFANSTAVLSQRTAQARAAFDASNGAIGRHAQAVREVTEANELASAREKEHAQEALRQNQLLAAAEAQRTQDVQKEAARRTQIERDAANQRIRIALHEDQEIRRRRERLQQAVSTFAASPVVGSDERQAAADARILAINERLTAVLQRKTAAQRAALGVSASGVPVLQKEAAATREAAAAKDRYTAATRRAATATGVFADTGRKSLSVYQRLRGQILQVGAAYLGIYQAVSLLRSAVETDQKRQQIRTQLLVVENNNAEKAAATYNFLRQEADRLGLTFEDLAKNFANYAISAKAAGLSTGEIRKTFVATAESVVGMRLSAEDADGVFRAMTQIMSKAKVQAEELRGQLGDRLPGAVAAFAKANNIALKDLDKLLKEGKVGVGELVVFIKEYAKQFQATLPRTTSTLISDLNRLKNVYGDFLQLLAQGQTGTALQQAIKDLSVFFKSSDGRRFAQELSTAFAAIINTIRVVIRNFDAFVTVIKLFLGLQVVKAIVSMGAALVTFITTIRTAATVFLTYRAAALAAAAGTGTFTVAMRALLLATGPVGIAFAALGAAIAYLVLRETEAEKTAARHKTEIDELKAAMSGSTRTAVNLAIETHAKARADLAAARAALEHAKALNKLEVEKQIANRNMVRRTGTSGLGNIPVRDTSGLEDEITELEKHEAALQKIRDEALAAHTRYIQEQLALEDEASNIQDPTGEDEDDSGAKESERKAEELARKREQLEENVASAIKAIDRDLLQAQQKTLEDRLKLIDFEINSRIEELQKIKAEALAQGQPDQAKLVDAAIAQLNTLRQIEKIEETKHFNQEKIAENEQKINDLLQQRQEIVETAQLLEQAGLITRTEAQARIEAANARLLPQMDQLILKAQEFINSLGNSPEAQAAQAALDNIRAKVEATKVELTATQRAWMNLGTQLAGGIVDAVGVLAKGLAGAIQGANSLGDAFKAARDAFLNFAADFLISIGQMILKAILLRALQNMIGGTKGGFFDAVVGAFSQHTGGIAGKDGKPRMVAASAFIGAQRFHGGGGPGLRRNEVPTILEKGEEVLTEEDARHQDNMKSLVGAGSTTEIAVMNSIDPIDMLQRAAGTPAGRKVIFNVVRADRASYKQLFQNN
jgi:tape measure domain-containing protein